MINRYTHKKLVWVDLESPNQEELSQIINEFGIHPLVSEELISPSLKPKVDLYKNFIYLILHFPTLGRAEKANASTEIDFIIGKNFLITTRYGQVDALHNFSKSFEVNSILDKTDMGDHAGFLFLYMVRAIYQSLIHQLDSIHESIKDIENKIFSGHEREMVMEISKMSRNLLDFKTATDMHKDVLESFEIAGKKFFGSDFDYYLRVILEEYYKTENAIRSNSELVSELRNTNDSLLNARQNEIMKTITIIIFLFLPFSVITGFFQMNTANTPFVGQIYDWFIIVGIEMSLAVILYILARSKKWL
jgi:magnesium transporter